VKSYEKILKNCIGFDWDEGNQNKNWQKHLVTKIEAEQVFFNEPLLIFNSIGLAEERFFALGKTNKNRLLAIIFTVRNKSFVRVISARSMSRKERSAYGKEK